MKKNSEYRPLSPSETETLKQNGCSADNWANIEVANGFDPRACINVTFSGNVRLGCFRKHFTERSGVTTPSGIRNAVIHNCIVGSDVHISSIGEYIANYIIEDEVIIINCSRISTTGPTRFGNGTSVAVLNETGGRNVKLFDRLSAHIAYIQSLYRHRKSAVDYIERIIEDYAQSQEADYGVIGHNSKLSGCGIIENTRFGPASRVEGAIRITDGTVNSTVADPSYIGPGVIMEHFIMCSGAIVSDSTLIDKCFIGQGCVLRKHYSAENSLFFANCGGYHGEACSVFAGPFTVTHHKSTLLIAGIFSFMNAGSGSNQSNHIYKLGPIHQGIMERGSKTTSDSYLLWPAHIGPFTLVMGRHYKNPDTSFLPFSYLIESNDESILVPGINLKSVGTIRDAQKWPLRDRRKDPDKIDMVNFNLLSPYTIRKMIDGRDFLTRIRSESKQDQEAYYHGGMKIAAHALERGIELYQTGINKFLGNSVIKRLENRIFLSNRELQERLKPGDVPGKGEWVDLAGLITPKSEVELLLDDIESGLVNDVKAMEERFRRMHLNYYEWEWSWVCDILTAETRRNVDELTATDIKELTAKWKKSVIDLDNMLYEDARKEFTLSSMTGFGIDGGDEVRQSDFEQVRGEFESNSVVNAIRDHIAKKTALGDELIERLGHVKD